MPMVFLVHLALLGLLTTKPKVIKIVATKSFHFVDVFIFILRVWAFCLHMYLCTRCASCPQRPAGCIRNPGTIVTENCGHPGEHREQNSDSGRATSVLVPQITFLKFSPFLFPCQHRVLTYEL